MNTLQDHLSTLIVLKTEKKNVHIHTIDHRFLSCFHLITLKKPGEIIESDYRLCASRPYQPTKFFANIGIRPAEKFHHASGYSINHPPATINPVSHFLDQVSLSEDQIKLKLTQIKQRTGGSDKIASRELAEAADSLFEGLFSIFKNSIQRGIFPSNLLEDWRSSSGI